MSDFTTLVRIETRIIMRSKVAVFWTFAFPIILMIAQARLAGGSLGHAGPDLTRVIAGVVAIVVVSTSLMGFAAPLIQARENGVLRSCSLWPMRQARLIGAMAAARLQVIGLAVGFIVFVSHWALKVSLPGNTVVFGLFLLFGALAMLTFGAAVGARASQTQTAIALCNLLYFGMIFLGEVFFQSSDLPPAVASLLAWLPVNALVHGLSASLRGSLTGLIQPCVALAIFWTISALVVDRTFVWTPTRRVRVSAK